MNNLLVTNIEQAHMSVTYDVNVQFDKNGETHEANVTCSLSVDENIGYDSWETTIANIEELPELKSEEIEGIEKIARKYAKHLAYN